MNDKQTYIKYFANNKKAQEFLLKENNNDTFNSFFNFYQNSFVGKIGFNNLTFNELTIKLITQTLINKIKNNNQKINFLLAHDGSDKQLYQFVLDQAYVLSANNINVIIFDKNQPVHESFLKYSLIKTQNITICSYLSRFTYDGQYKLSFYTGSGQPVNTKILSTISQEISVLDPFSIKTFQNDLKKINYEILVSEYTNFLTQNNLTQSINKLLNIGIIRDETSINFVRKIMGKNDFGYTLIKKNNLPDQPNEIKLPNILIKKHKQINYLVKFSYDKKKLYVYAKKESKNLFTSTFQLININDLILNYFVFANTVLITNKKYQPLKEIKYSIANDEVGFKNIAKKYELKINEVWNNKFFVSQQDNYLYLNENNEIYYSWLNYQSLDPYLTLTILSDMFNYYQTQELSFFEYAKKNLSYVLHNNISTFSYKCSFKNIESFETKIFNQKQLAGIDILQIEDLRDHVLEKEKYIAKFWLNENEWILIKYNFEYKNLDFIVSETIKTNLNVATKLKKFFKKFLSKYSNPLLNL
ncbi:hypothetical protein FJO69_00415 [[Mycoplasma] falconis]|uniref:Phosphomannomutase n=1 Tax=[Mycoplasma] falconis TaxID=92403 RepID=A0A501XC92_9BACT|nr:hypothetical protein [[Mycoplasma] falconis]TPE58059.1 hypothetical protein FJO69_00415 [[Mycoplasma] falconis]